MSDSKTDNGGSGAGLSTSLSKALLAFPVRHHFDCDVDQCRVCLNDHLALAEYIHAVTQAPRRFHDFLGEYRTWLDNHGIPAESENGWATRQAWDQENVHEFIWDVWGIDANSVIDMTSPSGTKPTSANDQAQFREERA